MNLIFLALIGCSPHYPSCEAEQTSLGWEEVSPLGVSGADLAAIAAGTWEEELVWEGGETTGLELEVNDLGEAVWSDSEATSRRWYQLSGFDISIDCNDSIGVSATIRLDSDDGDLAEVVDARVVFSDQEGVPEPWAIPEGGVSFSFDVPLVQWQSTSVVPELTVPGEVQEQIIECDGWFSPEGESHGELWYRVRYHEEGCTGRSCVLQSESEPIGAWRPIELP